MQAERAPTVSSRALEHQLANRRHGGAQTVSSSSADGLCRRGSLKQFGAGIAQAPVSLLLPRFVLEGDAKLRPIGNLATLGEVNILRHNLGDSQITNRAARRPDCNGRGILPGLSTSSNEVCNSVNAHAILLGDG